MRNHKSRRTFIGGVGVVSPVGNSYAELSKALAAGEVAVTAENYSGKSVGVARCEMPDKITQSAATRRFRTRWGQFALAAAQQAISDASTDLAESDGARGGVYIGMSNPPFDVIFDDLPRFQENGTVPPTSLIAALPNIAAAIISIEMGLTGRSHTYAMACASALAALARAHADVAAGELDFAVVGGVDCPLHPASVAGWQAVRVVAESHNGPGQCKPFSADRGGIILGEGASIFLIGDGDAVPEASRYAELLGFGETCDADHVTKPNRARQAACMHQAIEAAGIATEDIGLIVSHGTGTPVGDEMEALSICDVFGDRAQSLPVISNKGMLGHTLGASGAFNICSALMALKDGVIHPSAPTAAPDPTLPIHVPIKAVDAPANLKHVLVNAFAFGGINISAVLGQPTS